MIPFENEELLLIRKKIVGALNKKSSPSRSIEPIVNRLQLKKQEEKLIDLKYWLAQPASKRLKLSPSW